MLSSLFKPTSLVGLLLGIVAQMNAISNSPAFDGQYLQANSSNNAVGWWWLQTIAEPVNGNPPAAFQALFYQGYPFQIGPRDPAAPEFYIVINGFLPNGTQFSFTIPADSGTVNTSGQEVWGTWGSVGSFHASADLKTWNARFTAASFGVEGTINLYSNAPHHFGCNTTAGPYFSSAIPQGTTLNDAENLLFNQLGWATTIPGGSSSVDIMIDGVPLNFFGQGYHDANWAPQPLNAAVQSWFFGSAQIGVDVPTGFIIEYILEHGERFRFNLSSVDSAQNPDQNAYHRWVGTGTGGKVGETCTGLTLFEWLNPGLVSYVPSI